MTRFDRGVRLCESERVAEADSETPQGFHRHVDHISELLPRRRVGQIDEFYADVAEFQKLRSQRHFQFFAVTFDRQFHGFCGERGGEAGRVVDRFSIGGDDKIPRSETGFRRRHSGGNAFHFQLSAVGFECEAKTVYAAFAFDCQRFRDDLCNVHSLAVAFDREAERLVGIQGKEKIEIVEIGNLFPVGGDHFVARLDSGFCRG